MSEIGEFGTKSSYEAAEKWCENVIQSGHDLFFSLEIFDSELMNASRTLNFPIEALSSFLRNAHLNYIKKRTHPIRALIQDKIPTEYKSGISVLQLAKKYNFSPAMFARSLVDHITDLPKKSITLALRNPIEYLTVDLIHEEYRDLENDLILIDPFSGKKEKVKNSCTRLAKEILEAVTSDPIYGPRFDTQRNQMGVEYEMLLERSLKVMGISFENEEQLRLKGTSRTPDILFTCPVGIKVPERYDGSPTGTSNSEDKTEWKMICWIDSKALFGDVKSHQTVLQQAETYVHRYGPGLILYWFGHAPTELLSNAHGDVFVAGWNVPKLFMLATGDIAQDGRHSEMRSHEQ
jgi:hypothetical protein